MNLNNIPLIDFPFDDVVDVEIPNNSHAFEFLWRNKVFDYKRELYDYPEDFSCKHFYRSRVVNDEWLFLNRECLNYMEAIDFWRSSPEFATITFLINSTLNKSLHDTEYNYTGKRLNKNWDFTKVENKKDFVRAFCELAEQSDTERTGKYIKTLSMYSLKIRNDRRQCLI